MLRKEGPSYALRIGLAVALSATLLYMFGEILFKMMKVCWENDDYSHGVILPFAAAYIIWVNRDELNRRLSTNTITSNSLLDHLSPMVGGLILVIGATLFLLSQVGEIGGFLQWLSFFPVGTGILLLIFPRQVAALLIGPFLLNFMAKPIPDTLVPKLFGPFQNLAARISAHVLDLLNVPVHSMGNVIEIPGMKLLVEEACSGMRSLMALMTVALIVLMLVPFSWLIRVFIFCLAIALAVLLNIFRVAATGVLAYFWDPKIATGFFHTFSGLIVFVVGLTILYTLANWLSVKTQGGPPGREEAP